MNFIGIDLHKKIITVCVMNQNLKVTARKTLSCDQPDQIVEFCRQFAPFKAVIEATASYLWLVELLDPLAEKVVLANPKKLRVIAESTKKADRLDAQVLAEFLARDMIPESHMPTPRQRQHRRLVRHRQYLRSRLTSVRCRIRSILADDNADRKDLFSAGSGKVYLKQVALSDADRFVLKQMWAEFEDHQARLVALTKKIKTFAAKAPQREAEARQIVKTAPGVGFVTAEVVLSELGDVSSFRNAKTVCAYAGLVPSVRQSGGKRSKDLQHHQGRLGPVAVGLGGVGLAAGDVQCQMGRPLLPAAEAERQEAGHRGGGAEAAVRALRDAQDIDSLQGDGHLAGL